MLIVGMGYIFGLVELAYFEPEGQREAWSYYLLYVGTMVILVWNGVNFLLNFLPISDEGKITIMTIVFVCTTFIGVSGFIVCCSFAFHDGLNFSTIKYNDGPMYETEVCLVFDRSHRTQRAVSTAPQGRLNSLAVLLYYPWGNPNLPR